ncbi:DNA polymerase I, 5' -- 3' polymerase, 5' -- 3' and 3' -- 5' exonuclease [Campylobacter blaseri]|uniref:DNA polymerase I n=1 Tax=Campylobacter blaseri TaxID=2042961 RepID=A0A2P8QZE9_9BACT|nr:DNA polymerase I [Campylobacter blaseri]PSM51624.1 DNA polymerase I [Campylobacter blaseri]PSM53417.1 DNA polymerase I [Campylobacter blaseri]QKF86713.1 DNA polymerase I, 5' -- 3' polymerase, 5' -- 3' and 3' -- 5' exonuclease [Campylobacter blaseri]
MKTLTIIDTFGFFFRLYYAMSSLRNKEGKPSGMVYGFANFIANLESEFKSDYIIFALDSKGKTFRSEIDPNYKINRQTPPEALLEQLPVCIEMIEKMELCSIAYEGYEADDVIGSVVEAYKNDDMLINIVTHDKDLYQLISDKVRIYSPAKKEIYDEAGCIEKYGVKPSQIRDFLAIVGDSSDNIPGVKGIGEKGAKKLLDQFKDIEDIYENLDKVANVRSRNLLIESKENAFLSKKLATIYKKLEIPNLELAKFPTQNPLLKIKDILAKYSLNRILSSLEAPKIKKDGSFEDILIDSEEELERLLVDINEDTLVSFDTETTGVDSKIAKIVGFSFCFNEEKSYYVPLTHSYLGVPKQISLEFAKWAIAQIYKGHVIGHNLKYDFAIVKNNFDLNPPKNYIDTMIMAWLNDPGTSVGMDNLAKRLYDYNTVKFEKIVKKGETFADIDVKEATKYASEDAWITFKFYQTLKSLLDDNLLNLAKSLEFPFIEVLLFMEETGISIDRDLLRDMIAKLDVKLKALTNEIYELSGERFNINSTKQLGVVLFENLGLKAKKKTKTGYSTDESVLSALVDEHPVIEKLLSYRELYKLQSTYTQPLLNLALKDENSRIYTSFLQTGTSTGRLSSKNPNLQNIPAHGSLAKQMRQCFVSKKGYSFISLDYSQIELRLLAHFSEDKALVEAFKNAEDIHARTAISIFGQSDSEKRAIAKSINFGLIYGMGANKLSNELGISRNDARDYIQRYFKAFSTIKDFLENIKTTSKELGYITTLLGRKRYFDFSSATPMQLAMYEREAVNTRFQGSAADIIKLAMVKFQPLLNDEIKMLLQIHDELIFEVKDELVDEFSKKAQNLMQNIYALKVPLVCSLDAAKNWGDLK